MMRYLLSFRLCLRNFIGSHDDHQREPSSAVTHHNHQHFLARGASRRSAVFLLVGLLATVVLSLAPSLAWAQESLRERASSTWERLRGDPDTLVDRLLIRGGYGSIFGANTTFTANGPLGVGTSIDFEQALGGETGGDLNRVDAWFRFNRRHSLGFTWYAVDRTGSRVLAEDIEFDGSTFKAGGAIFSRIDITLYRLMYNWSFYHNDKVELAISPGVYLANVGLSIAGDLTKDGVPIAGGEASEDLTLPLPSIGGVVNYNITPRWLAQLRADAFYLSVGDFSGTMFELYAGLEYRLFKYFALGLAYDLFAVSAKKSDVDSGWKFTNAWNMIYFYGTLYAFDTPL